MCFARILKLKELWLDSTLKYISLLWSGKTQASCYNLLCSRRRTDPLINKWTIMNDIYIA